MLRFSGVSDSSSNFCRLISRFLSTEKEIPRIFSILLERKSRISYLCRDSYLQAAVSSMSRRRRSRHFRHDMITVISIHNAIKLRARHGCRDPGRGGRRSRPRHVDKNEYSTTGESPPAWPWQSSASIKPHRTRVV